MHPLITALAPFKFFPPSHTSISCALDTHPPPHSSAFISAPPAHFWHFLFWIFNQYWTLLHPFYIHIKNKVHGFPRRREQPDLIPLAPVYHSEHFHTAAGYNWHNYPYSSIVCEEKWHKLNLTALKNKTPNISWMSAHQSCYRFLYIQCFY